MLSPHEEQVRRLGDTILRGEDEIKSLQAEVARLRAAGEKICEGFDLTYFVRNTDKDVDPAWAIKLMPYLQAIAVFVKDEAKALEAPDE